jgi:hypothetical protein
VIVVAAEPVGGAEVARRLSALAGLDQGRERT